jgi:aminocarboxymuconate-semialdehyde decarboxylase
MTECKHGMIREQKAGNTAGASIDRRGFIKLGAGVGAVAMSALEAGQILAQGTPGKGKSIDLHTHWTPPAYLEAISKLHMPPEAAVGTTVPAAADSPAMNLGKRIAWMDAHGVQIHVLTLSGGMPWEWVTPSDGHRLAQIVNDAGIAAHQKYPTRFMAGIEMDVRDPQGALKELNRVAGKPGLRAVHLPNSMDNKDYLFEPDFAPVLKRVEELGYPLLFHPLDGMNNIYGGKERLGNPLAISANINNTLGFTFDSATIATKFIISGTLDKFPKLDIVLPHSGGCFPYVAGRIERGLKAKKFAIQKPFRDYIRRFHYDSMTWYPETMRFLVSLVGADRVVIGTDNYAAMDVEYPNQLVESINLPEKDLDLILKGNASRLLKI